jgi:hypothetical protein
VTHTNDTISPNAGDGSWVMVRDQVAAAGLPNWFFMPRGCLTLG